MNCSVPWTWYLACDMQFHMLALLVMQLYFRAPRAAAAVAAAVTLGSMIAGYVIADENHLSRNLEPYVGSTPLRVCIAIGAGSVLW
jgi:hypothetical protein